MKQGIVGNKAVIWCIVSTHKVREFLVMRSCTPNSKICMGLQDTHEKLSSRISHVTLNYTRNVSDSRAVVQYAERPYMTYSFHVTCMCV